MNMKLLLVTCLEDFKAEITALLQQARVNIFSFTETTGVKTVHDANLLDDWFGNKEGEFRSLLFFSFTTAESAAEAVQLIHTFNENGGHHFPARVFIMQVESSNYTP